MAFATGKTAMWGGIVSRTKTGGMEKVPLTSAKPKDPYYRLGIPTRPKVRDPLRSASPWNSDMLTLFVFQACLLIFLLVVVFFFFK